MSGFNMPPGVSPSDIPGNRVEDMDSEEELQLEEAVSRGFDKLEEVCFDPIRELVTKLVTERNNFQERCTNFELERDFYKRLIHKIFTWPGTYETLKEEVQYQLDNYII